MNPSSPILANTSRWTAPFSSHSRMWGTISASAKSRTDWRTSRFSSVRAKSTTKPSFRAEMSGRAECLAEELEPLGDLGRSHVEGWDEANHLVGRSARQEEQAQLERHGLDRSGQ